MNQEELMKLLNKAQETWLDNCIKFYGFMINGTEELLKQNKAYYEKLQQQAKNKDGNK